MPDIDRKVFHKDNYPCLPTFEMFGRLPKLPDVCKHTDMSILKTIVINTIPILRIVPWKTELPFVALEEFTKCRLCLLIRSLQA